MINGKRKKVIKKMRKLNAIKRTVNYGLTILIGFNLFVGCEDREYYEEDSVYYEDELCYNISFQVGLPLDINGYYHLEIDRGTWQTLHRVSGVITDNDYNFVENFWMEWDSDLYWVLGDTLGYIVNRYLNNSGVYVSVDTSYIIGFNGMEVPTSNIISYSNSYGEFNNMIAPVKSMIGDTLRLTADWYYSKETIEIVLD